MSFGAFLFQAINGLSTASGLFFIAVGLSLIFGVSRIINIAHGSLYMLGTYVAYTFATRLGGAFGFWGGIVATALIVGVLGALIEIVLLRRVYRAPELFQLLATFALVLVINDAALWLWGPEDLLGPRAPGLRGSIEVLRRQLPSYDLFLIVIAPLVLLALRIHQRALRVAGAAAGACSGHRSSGGPVSSCVACAQDPAPTGASPYSVPGAVRAGVAILADGCHPRRDCGGLCNFAGVQEAS